MLPGKKSHGYPRLMFKTHFKIFSKVNAVPPKIMPISGTLPNSKIYITDSNMSPVPIGAVGEIIAGGIGIGRGYLNRPELTKERYVPDVFFKERYCQAPAICAGRGQFLSYFL